MESHHSVQSRPESMLTLLQSVPASPDPASSKPVNHEPGPSFPPDFAPPPPPESPVTPSQKLNFLDPELAKARKVFLTLTIGGCVAVILLIFCVFSVYWGALYNSNRPLSGWIVDFDGQDIGSQVSQALQSLPVSTIRWEVVSSSNFPGGLSDVATAVAEEDTWVVITINPNATQKLNQAALSIDASYNGSSAITIYAAEARQETAFRSFIRPNVQTALPLICQQAGAKFSQQLAASGMNVTAILQSAPQIMTTPIFFTIDNLKPFDMTVATATIFVGLIYLLVLTFFLLNVAAQARTMAGLDGRLTFWSFVRLRLGFSLISYFFISFFYSLLNVAFQVKVDRHFGHAGFFLLWMVNYAGMSALGLALESMMTVMTIRYVGFFLIPWMVVNVSVVVLPMPVQNTAYRYGHAMPFYNVSRAVRAILFGTKNELGMNFGILLAWSALSCLTLVIFLVIFRKRDERALQAENSPSPLQMKEKEVV